MAPAFTSTRQALAFATLLILILLSPVLVARTGWLSRRDLYPAIPWKHGSFPWIQQKVYAETQDVDIAFLGSSHIWNAVYPPYVQAELSKQLGRPAQVFTLGWPWPGFDAVYTMAHDLLAHRRVRMLVVYDEPSNDAPHLQAGRWFRIGDDPSALEGLSWQARAALYGSAVLGMPRQLLSLVRSNLLEDPARCHPNFWNSYYRAPHVATQGGALCARLGYGVTPDFTPFEPHGGATPADVRVYSKDTRDSFEFTNEALPPYQLHFAVQLARLCREHGTRLVMLHTPTVVEGLAPVIRERQLWPKALGGAVDIVGIAPKKLFAGLSESERLRLFYETQHLNQNGQLMFTKLITNTLIDLYDPSSVHP